MTTAAEQEARRKRAFRTTVTAWTVYPAGDLVAQLIIGHVNPYRVLMMALVGGLVYRFEKPWWIGKLEHFQMREETVERWRWLRIFLRQDLKLNPFGRTVGAMVYFNPLWIARHMLFLRLATDPASVLAVTDTLRDVVRLGTRSFVTFFPVSVFGNYIIQVHVPLRRRFLASGTMSGLLATGYAFIFRYLR